MDTKFQIVDVEGDPIEIAHFEEGVDIPVKLKSMRMVEGQMILTLEYLHGSTPCQEWASIDGYRQICNVARFEGEECERSHRHC